MNRTIRNLVIAVPLATVGLTMVNTAAAVAGPDVIVIPKPKPQPPKDIAIPKPDPKPDFPIADAPKPKGPQDKAPKPQSTPQGGNQTAAPVAETVAPVETAQVEEEAAEVVSAKGSPDSIDRSDILFVAGPAETSLDVAASDNGMDLTWLLVGGGIVTASGIAFAARKRANA